MTPEGWKRTTLGKVASITSGGTPSRDNPQFWNGLIAWVTTGEITGRPIESTSEYISELGLRNSSAKIFPAGTLLMAMYGQGKTRGRISQLKIDAATNQACAAILVSNAADASFLLQNLTARYDEIRTLSNDGSQKNLSGVLLKALPLLLPPPGERMRIAEILGTWDRAIETVEALVANADAQKAALMQQLLTGASRISGFEDEWRNTTLGEIANVIVSNVDKKSNAVEREVRLCNYTDVYGADRIHADMPFMTATASDAEIARYRLRLGDVLITKDSETSGDIAVPSYVASTAPDLICGYHLAIVRPQKADGQFLKFLFEHPNARQHFASRANGVTRFGLTIGAIEGSPIRCPSIDEQTRIGTIIRTAEVAAEVLKLELAQIRQEKASLMQQLLTGKRRVKLDVAAAP